VLVADSKNNRIVTNMLAKLIFQDHYDQKSGVFQNQQPILRLLWACKFFSHFSGVFRTAGSVGTLAYMTACLFTTELLQ